MARTEIVPETVFKETDKYGTSFYVIDKFGRSPKVELFYADGGLMLRQENGRKVDILNLSIGQTNDLLMAVALALEIPVRVQ